MNTSLRLMICQKESASDYERTSARDCLKPISRTQLTFSCWICLRSLSSRYVRFESTGVLKGFMIFLTATDAPVSWSFAELREIVLEGSRKSESRVRTRGRGLDVRSLMDCIRAPVAMHEIAYCAPRSPRHLQKTTSTTRIQRLASMALGERRSWSRALTKLNQRHLKDRRINSPPKCIHIIRHTHSYWLKVDISCRDL